MSGAAVLLASLGSPTIAKDCEVKRITEVENATTREAAATAAYEVTLGGPRALLWGSMPCTGGTSWTHINKMFPSALKKILRHQRIFKQMWKQWELVAESTRAAGGTIALELPSNCIYWKWPMVQRFVCKYGLKKARCNGCAFGLKGGPDGLPIYKPWTIATDDQCLLALYDRST